MKLQDVVRLAKQAAKHANSDSARRFTQHVVPEVVRPARVVWNQAIGALFFVLALPAALKGWQLYRDLDTAPKNGASVAILAIFVIVMVSFGTSSFLKARRIASQVNRY